MEPTILDFRMLGLLGKGAYAEVKLGQHRRDLTKHAIKVYDKSRLDSKQRRNVCREINVLKCLVHPNIV